MMPKPACVKCQRFYRPKQNSHTVLESMPIESGATPGSTEPQQWQPYKIWSADLWECQGCGHQLLSGWGKVAITEHYMDNFDGWMAAVQTTINDC
jgi:hypothetical protein